MAEADTCASRVLAKRRRRRKDAIFTISDQVAGGVAQSALPPPSALAVPPENVPGGAGFNGRAVALCAGRVFLTAKRLHFPAQGRGEAAVGTELRE